MNTTHCSAAHSQLLEHLQLWLSSIRCSKQTTFDDKLNPPNHSPFYIVSGTFHYSCSKRSFYSLQQKILLKMIFYDSSFTSNIKLVEERRIRTKFSLFNLLLCCYTAKRIIWLTLDFDVCLTPIAGWFRLFCNWMETNKRRRREIRSVKMNMSNRNRNKT